MWWHVLLVPLLPLATAWARNPWNPDRLTPQQIRNIAWGSGTCEHAAFVEECVTAETATAYIRNALVRYNISSPMEQAAVISVMAYESEDFKLNRDHNASVIGTGSTSTRRFCPRINPSRVLTDPQLGTCNPRPSTSGMPRPFRSCGPDTHRPAMIRASS
jgi:hypothetical protein